MDEMIDTVLAQSSRAEQRHMAAGDESVALWLIKRTLDLTSSQAESLANRIVDRCHAGAGETVQMAKAEYDN